MDEAPSERHHEVRGLAESHTLMSKQCPLKCQLYFFFALSIYLSTLFFKVSTLESKNGKIGHAQIKWLFK